MRIKKIHFINDLLEQHKISNIYKSLNYSFNESIFYESEETDERVLVEINIAFPKFLIPTFNNNYYQTKKITQKYLDGFGIIIDPNTKDISQYLNTHFSKNSRAPIIKKMKRLESCFNIHYKVFYGAIVEETYTNLMHRTHAMLMRRFEQRKDNNFILNDWNKYVKLLFPLINNREASLFVIYNDVTPIQVSINFHYEKTFFAYIPAYDIDYAQFGLGNTAVYKQLEWCVENKYVYLDMGNGDYDYKKRWCNYSYELETHVYYKKSSISANILALKEINKIQFKNKAKDLLNSRLIKKIKEYYKTKTNKKISFSNNNIEKIDIEESNLTLKKIDLTKNSKREYLNEHIYNFIYTYKEHFDTISVYKISNETDSFIVKGKDNSIKIIFNK